jgi:hypothetical protein
MSLTVGIMGAGRMAQGFDAPGDDQVLSLAHAVARVSGMTLGGFYDSDPDRARIAEQRWDVTESPRQRDGWLGRDWDIICIATPDEQHGCDLADVLAHRPRAVVVEKPLSTDPDEADDLLKQAAGLGIPILVDYPRRFHSGVQAVMELIETGELGEPVSASFAHSGSAAHAGVHMFDLFHGWWDRDWEVTHEGSSGDTNLLTLRNGELGVPLCIARLPGDPYYLWDMSILCRGGSIALTHSPELLEVSVPAPHPLYPDFQVLTPHLAFEMEAEPLLPCLMDAALAVVGDSSRARAHTALEQRRQHFSGSILRCLAGQSAAATTQRAAS